jgi:hypothetical protein
MFVFREDDATGTYLIPQVSHAWLAWQVAEHWGNRLFARPAPRAETLAAILLHDGGWAEFDGAPSLDEDGRPRTFDRMPVSGHLSIWRSSIVQAAQYSRYAGLLVGAHFLSMAERKLADLLERNDMDGARATQAFVAEMERREKAWFEELTADARYQPYLAGPGREINSRLLDTCDRISVYLCASLPAPFEVWASNAAGETEVITFETVDATTWRVQPWPLQGDRLQIHCEGRRLAASTFADEQRFRETLNRAPTVRLVFTLLRSSAVG